MKKTVIVIEDEEILLESYKYFFDSFEEYELKGAYSSVEDAMKYYEDIYPDIVLSDISLPGMNGIDAIKKIHQVDEYVKIMLISIHDDLSHVLEAIQNEVDGYLTKPISREKLLIALNSLMMDGAPLSVDISKKILEHLKKKKLEILTERENEVVELLAKGDTYKMIAEKLFLSHSTINYHIQKIYTKLGVTSKPEALKKVEEMYSKS